MKKLRLEKSASRKVVRMPRMRSVYPPHGYSPHLYIRTRRHCPDLHAASPSRLPQKRFAARDRRCTAAYSRRSSTKTTDSSLFSDAPDFSPDLCPERA
eukprot:1574911-Rhodomonas_salina.3